MGQSCSVAPAPWRGAWLLRRCVCSRSCCCAWCHTLNCQSTAEAKAPAGQASLASLLWALVQQHTGYRLTGNMTSCLIICYFHLLNHFQHLSWQFSRTPSFPMQCDFFFSFPFPLGIGLQKPSKKDLCIVFLNKIWLLF